MGKRQDREDRLLENLQNQNRELKQINRSLQKKLKQLSRGYYKFMVAQDKEEEKEAVESAKEVAKKLCHDCQGEYREIIIVNRRFRQCQDCGKKGRVTVLS